MVCNADGRENHDPVIRFDLGISFDYKTGITLVIPPMIASREIQGRVLFLGNKTPGFGNEFHNLGVRPVQTFHGRNVSGHGETKDPARGDEFLLIVASTPTLSASFM